MTETQSRTHRRFLALVLHAALLLAGPASACAGPAVTTEHLLDAVDRVEFLENRGQIHDTRGSSRPDILYTAGAAGVNLYFTRHGISYLFTRFERSPSGLRFRPTLTAAESYRMDLEFIGANPDPVIIPELPTGHPSNVHIDGAPTPARAGSWGRLIYRDLYPHIDLVLYSNGKGLKYDIVVHPGGRVDDVRFRYVAASVVERSPDGGLRVANPLGTLREQAPMTFLRPADRATAYLAAAAPGDHTVPSSYIVSGDTISYRVGRYAHGGMLVIDPGIVWATYYGGNGLDGTGGMALDAAGNIYVAGFSYSPNFPVDPGAASRIPGGGSLGGSSDAFVAKFDGAGKRIWATYFGGEESDLAQAIAIDRRGDVVIVGGTQSSRLPVTANAVQKNYAGGELINTGGGSNSATNYGDAFAAKLDPDGNLIWSTYYGGSSNEFAFGVAIDSADNVVMVGATASRDFPITGTATQSAFGGRSALSDASDMFVVKFDRDGTRLWGTYYGGDASETAYGVATDVTGDILVVGSSEGGTFRTTPGAFGPKHIFGTDVVAVELDGNGVLRWSSFYAGKGDEAAFAAAMLPGDMGLIGGWTSSSDFPVTGGVAQATLAGRTDGFIIKVDPNGKEIWGTYLGGASIDQVKAIALDPNGTILAGCLTFSDDLPVTADAISRRLNGGQDAMLARLSGTGGLIWETYLGGSGSEDAFGIGVDSRGSVIAYGLTSSNDFPVTKSPQQSTLGGGIDIFLVKLGCSISSTIPITGDSAICGHGGTLLSAPPGYGSYRWSNDSTGRTVTITAPGTYTVTVGDSLGCTGLSGPFTVSLKASLDNAFAITGDTAICAGEKIRLSAPPGYAAYRWAGIDSTTQSVTIAAPGTYVVAVSDSTGCSGSSRPFTVSLRPPFDVPITAPGEHGGTAIICSGGSLAIEAPSGFATYSWSNGDTTRTISVDREGTYSVIVTDPNGCIGVSRIVAVAVRPAPAPPVLSQCGSTLTVGAGSGFQWLYGDSLIPGATGRSFTAGTLGRYSVIVTDDNGCAVRSAPYDLSDVAPARVIISLPVIAAAAGDYIEFPLIVADRGRLSGRRPRPYRLVIAWNRSLAIPIDTGIVVSESGRERIVEIHGIWDMANDTLGLIGIQAALGDSGSTALSVRSLTWEGDSCPPDVTVRDGLLTVALCNVGGSRLFLETGGVVLKPVRPNPVSGMVQVDFSTIEPGRTHLYVADLLGHTVLTLHDGPMPLGTHTEAFGTEGLPTGTYVVILTTPTGEYSRLMRVQR
ncbi:MAG: hypothetical protein JWQ98_2818 [Chlorobi bacterium]|nr:hypothetical protein [Chlorobiota bacterium]